MPRYVLEYAGFRDFESDDPKDVIDVFRKIMRYAKDNVDDLLSTCASNVCDSVYKPVRFGTVAEVKEYMDAHSGVDSDNLSAAQASGKFKRDFGSTNAYDSIQWGIPNMIGVNKVSSCIANLKQFYTIQDVLVAEYTKESFYASVKGRIDDDENVISKPHTILQNILDKELGYTKDVILPDEDIQDD